MNFETEANLVAEGKISDRECFEFARKVYNKRSANERAFSQLKYITAADPKRLHKEMVRETFQCLQNERERLSRVWVLINGDEIMAKNRIVRTISKQMIKHEYESLKREAE